MRPLCIYHGACDDGFAAAMVVRSTLGVNGVELYPGVYQTTPPDCAGRDVIFVDFSYKRPVLDEIAAVAHSVIILDHHKTAEEDLADLPRAPHYYEWRERAWGSNLPPDERMVALFDMKRSGAVMAFDYFVRTPS